jgi:3-oxoacyl-[acyl-carrier protein] reductase
MTTKVLQGRPAVVTGASRGIGAAIAKCLAAAGALVWITYRDQQEAAENVARDIHDAGGWARTERLEVTDRKDIACLAARIEEEHGALAVLVNNAGINKPTDFDQITDEDWDRIVGVNLKGPFLVTQGLLPLLRLGARRWGDASVVHIGSVSGQYGGPRTAHYAASKAGLISLAQVIARFGARDGVRSNTLSAGLIQSDMGAAGLANPAVQKAAETILLKRLGTYEEVADAALYLASPGSSYVTGQVLNVNGGLYF